MGGSQLRALAALLLVAAAVCAAAGARRGAECTQLVQQYMQDHTADFEAPHDINKMLFFLHVPRTAGKTYANCFLRAALPPSVRCAKGYDRQRLNVSTEHCRLFISHDDFSVTKYLPRGGATITQLRRPVDRVISSYEFAIDIAAKGVLSTGPPRRSAKSKRKPDFIGTLEVYPWSILIPWFKKDMNARMSRLKQAARDDITAWHEFKSPDNRTYYWNEAQNKSVWVLPEPETVLDPYNNSLVMPLHEWIEHPIAQELIHNAATLQVLGLTNYSHWEGYQALRGCLQTSPISREMLLNLAVKRLKSMAHVGLTEKLEQSVLSMAADLGVRLNSTAYKYTSALAFSYDGGDWDDAEVITYNATIEGNPAKNMTRQQLMQYLGQLVEEVLELRPQADDMGARLQELVDQETAWLQQQEEESKAEAEGGGTEDGSAAAGESSEGEGQKGGEPAGTEDAAAGAGRELKSETAAGAAARAAATAGGVEQAAAAGLGSQNSAHIASKSNEAALGGSQEGLEEEAKLGSGEAAAAAGQGGGRGRRRKLLSAPELHADGQREGAASVPDSKARVGDIMSEPYSFVVPAVGRRRSADGIEGQVQQQQDTDATAAAAAAAGDGGSDGAKTEEQAEVQADDGRIDSRWDAEIRQLDDRLYDVQERIKALERELQSIWASDMFTEVEVARGRARQLIPDSYFRVSDRDLADEYKRCAQAGKTRRDKRKIYTNLRTPWGETFKFVATDRRRIGADITRRILQLNHLDTELYRAGERLLQAKLEAQEKAGLLESFPKPQSPSPPSPPIKAGGRGRRLRSKLSSSSSRGRGRGSSSDGSISGSPPSEAVHEEL